MSSLPLTWHILPIFYIIMKKVHILTIQQLSPPYNLQKRWQGEKNLSRVSHNKTRWQVNRCHPRRPWFAFIFRFSNVPISQWI